jgi:hypothetical protein
MPAPKPRHIPTPVKIPEEVKAEAKRLYESGLPSYTVARRLGINYDTLGRWVRTEAWVQTLTAPCQPGGDIDSAIAALSQKSSEAAYDEKIRQIALSIPFILGKLDVAELVGKADKVAKLVTMSREILGKVDKGRGGPVISVGILSAGGLPRRAAQVELIDNEIIAEDPGQ